MKLFKYAKYLFACLITPFIFVAVIANAAPVSTTAPDSTKNGPHKVLSAEYKLPASIDADVLANTYTEVWAKMFYPGDIAETGKLPLVVMLHGNHATCGIGSNPRRDSSCEYTQSGTCPTGYVPVPNHEGYNYLAENLASWGMMVVSINANRGITCGGGNGGDWGLNLARGKLVLKHLSLLKKWSTSGGAPTSLGLGDKGLVDKIDFGSVGLLGHSRGGEGVRAAYNLYNDPDSPWPSRIPDLAVKAIFEIGAVDGQTSRVLDADGTVWNQLLPMCDGDVSDLEGRFPFDRMMLRGDEKNPTQKSLYEVWGANHNFFNTEWQSSDSWGCSGGKPIFDRGSYFSREQQTVALASVPAFFRSRLGTSSDLAMNQNFNPLRTLPTVVTSVTQVDRDFTATPSREYATIADDFDKDTGINTSGNKNLAQSIKIEHKTLDSTTGQRVAEIFWNNAGSATFYQAVLAPAGQGKDIHDYATLDIRMGRVTSKENPDKQTDFSVSLLDASGLMSNLVSISDYVVLNGPGSNEPVLLTARIPLAVFKNVNLNNVNSVRVTFNKSKNGRIYLANMRAHKQAGIGETVDFANQTPARDLAVANPQPALTVVPASQNAIVRIRRVQKSYANAGEPAVEISFSSQVPYDVMNRLPILKVGNKEFKLSRYTDLTNLKEITFTLTDKQYQSVDKDADITITNGKLWKFSTLRKVAK